MASNNAEDMLTNTNSQSAQDMFVLKTLNNKRNGYFLEIGTNHPININNSYILEKKYGWNGLLVEYDAQWEALYKQHRSSKYVISDARAVDYAALFKKYEFPKNMDYLQIDLEVSTGSTIETLEHLETTIFPDYTFSTVTFEHDIYHSNFGNTRLESRILFKKRGYVCVFEDINNEGNPYEDWYVHPYLVDMNYVNNLIENNKTNYMNHPFTGKTINWKDIQYN